MRARVTSTVPSFYTFTLLFAPSLHVCTCVYVNTCTCTCFICVSVTRVRHERKSCQERRNPRRGEPPPLRRNSLERHDDTSREFTLTARVLPSRFLFVFRPSVCLCTCFVFSFLRVIPLASLLSFFHTLSFFLFFFFCFFVSFISCLSLRRRR